MPRIEQVTISSGTSTSTSASKREGNIPYSPSAIILSGSYSNTSFDVQAKFAGSWYDVYSIEGSKINITVASGKHSLSADDFKDIHEVRLNGSTNETSDVTADILFRQI